MSLFYMQNHFCFVFILFHFFRFSFSLFSLSLDVFDYACIALQICCFFCRLNKSHHPYQRNLDIYIIINIINYTSPSYIYKIKNQINLRKFKQTQRDPNRPDGPSGRVSFHIFLAPNFFVDQIIQSNNNQIKCKFDTFLYQFVFPV